MKIFKHKQLLKNELLTIRNISFVPTMGSLHKGHLHLIKCAKKRRGKVVVSIYINPKQFESKKDFNSYPVNLKNDISILKKLKVDILYLPFYKDLFIFTPENKIYLHKFVKELCGKYRKSHFEGVINVVNRFVEIINPKYLYLGQKDFQQMFLIKKHIRKNKIKTKIITCKTVRESNNVACSSRNKNLTKKQFKIASSIYSVIHNCKKKIKKKGFSQKLIQDVIKQIKNLGVKKIDYVELVNLANARKVKSNSKKFNLFIAYYLGDVRLIDNI